MWIDSSDPIACASAARSTVVSSSSEKAASSRCVGCHADTFVWLSILDTGNGGLETMDFVTDFNPAQGDQIDLTTIDADETTDGHQLFTLFTDGVVFTEPAQIRFLQDVASHSTFLILNVDGSPDNDAVIRLSGLLTPDSSWFVHP